MRNLLLVLVLLALPAAALAEDGENAAFREVPGVQEFSGRLIARPLQASALEATGMVPAQVSSLRLRAADRLADLLIRVRAAS